jgi:hypothetical protein
MLLNISILFLFLSLLSFLTLTTGVMLASNSMNKAGELHKSFARLFYKHTYLPSRYYVRHMIILGATCLVIFSGSFCGLVFSGVL